MTSFDEFYREIEAEARAAGPKAVAHLREKERQYKMTDDDTHIPWERKSKGDRVLYLLLESACGLTGHMMWASDGVADWWYEHVCRKVGELMDD